MRFDKQRAKSTESLIAISTSAGLISFLALGGLVWVDNPLFAQIQGTIEAYGYLIGFVSIFLLITRQVKRIDNLLGIGGGFLIGASFALFALSNVGNLIISTMIMSIVVALMFALNPRKIADGLNRPKGT